MHCSPFPRRVNVPTYLSGARDAARVSLTGILRQGGKLYLTVADGRRNWIIEATPNDIATFDHFRRRVESHIGEPISHDCQDRRQHHQRQLAWCEAIRKAHRRGQGR